jgi:hypothetical protein
MSERTFLVGKGSGQPNTPIGGCGWDEQFDEGSIAELMAKYQHPWFGNSWNNNASPGADTDHLELSGGRLLIHGTSPVYGFTISPGYLPHSTGVWYRLECEMIGGDYDAPLELDPYLFDINVHLDEAFGRIITLTGAPQSVNPIDLPARSGNLWALIATAPAPPNPNPEIVYSTISDVMAEGAHTIILYMSTSASGEFWYDAAPGDAPDASISEPAYPAGFIFHQTQINGPAGAGLTLAIGRIQIACGSRSSDPFGIL